MVISYLTFAAVKWLGYYALAKAREDLSTCPPSLVVTVQVVIGYAGFRSLDEWAGPLLDRFVSSFIEVPEFIWFVGLLLVDRVLLWILVILFFYRSRLPPIDRAGFVAKSVAYSFVLDIPAFGAYLLVGGDPLGRW